MTIFQVHLLMFALGTVAAFVITGSKIFKHPNTKAISYAPNTQQRLLGFLALLIVSASPLIRYLRDAMTNAELLQQSLLVSAIGLLALLLFALLQRPSREETDEVASHIDIGAGQEIVIQDQTVTIDRTDANEAGIDVQAEQADLDDQATELEGHISLGRAANDHDKNITDSSNLAFLENLDLLIDENKKSQVAPQDLQDTDLDLSETEELYADLIAQGVDVELPENEDWIADFDESVNLDDSLLLADEHLSSHDLESDQPIIDGELLNAEIEADSAMSFGDDATGEYAHPDDLELSSPETLEEALKIGKEQALAMQENVDVLNNKLVELQSVHKDITEEQFKSQLTSAQMIIKRDELLDHEASARKAAEAVITAQRTVLNKTKNHQLKIGHLLLKERKRLALYRVDAERSKATARQAAALARKAATTTQAIRDVAKREKLARVRSQQSAKRAVDIARNAISALAAEERKNARINH